jgi:hypothetical protein
MTWFTITLESFFLIDANMEIITTAWIRILKTTPLEWKPLFEPAIQSALFPKI